MEHESAPDTPNTVRDSAGDESQSPAIEAEIDPGAPSFVAPQEFYRAASQRADIRRILAALAKCP